MIKKKALMGINTTLKKCSLLLCKIYKQFDNGSKMQKFVNTIQVVSLQYFDVCIPSGWRITSKQLEFEQKM